MRCADAMGKNRGKISEPADNMTDSSPMTAPDRTSDQWLTHYLRQLYDPVLTEPLPADLLRALKNQFD
jgi:hypothetical protein